MPGQIAVGTVEGTGAAINVSIGFQPRIVECFNIDDAGSVNAFVKWISGMGAGKGLKSVKIADNGSTGGKCNEYIATGGITVYAGSSTVGSEAGEGFSIGTDGDLNVNGETIVYAAYE